MSKKIVHYDDELDFHIALGKSAFVHPIDHTSQFVSNKKMVRTTAVQMYDEESGMFETLNTVYRPASRYFTKVFVPKTTHHH